MALNARETADINTLIGKINDIYTRLGNCGISDVVCTDVPDILDFPFTDFKGKMFMSTDRLMSIHNAFWNLLGYKSIRSALLKDANRCDEYCYFSEDQAICHLLTQLTATELKQPQPGVPDNNTWINQVDGAVDYILGLFSAGENCPDICAPSWICPCETWPDEDPACIYRADPGGFPCDVLDFEYNMDNNTTSLYDGTTSVLSSYYNKINDEYDEVRVTSPALMQAEDQSCKWSHDPPVTCDNITNVVQRRYTLADGTMSSWNAGAPIWARCWLDTVNCMWTTDGISIRGFKKTGQTPAGDYSGGSEDSDEKSVTGATVTELAP